LVVIVTLNGLPVPLALPDQPPKPQPGLGVAVTDMMELEVYKACAGLEVTVPFPFVATVRLNSGTKFAVMVLFVVITTSVGLTCPFASPDQLLKTHPGAGT